MLFRSLVNEFDKKTKLTFKNKPLYVQINTHERDIALGIRGNALRLAAYVIVWCAFEQDSDGISFRLGTTLRDFFNPR